VPVRLVRVRQVGKRVSGCGTYDATCTVKIPLRAGNAQYSFVQVGITNVQGVGISNDYYAVVAAKAALIEGTILDKEGQPVPGAAVSVYGAGHGEGNYEASTGPDGSYAVEVTPGHYRVAPSVTGLSRAAPKIKPTDEHVSVGAGGTAKANFTVETALIVRLSLSASTVPADGMHIVQGTITAKYDGAPAAGLTIDVSPKLKEDPAYANNTDVKSGALATVCNGTSRIWPQGTIIDPNGNSAYVQLDANGKYAFTIDVGTVPGPLSVTAWAVSSVVPSLTTGTPINVDTADASDTQTLDLTSLGHMTAKKLESELHSIRGAANLAAVSNDAGALTAALGGIAAKGLLGGVAFSWINGTNGSTAVLAYDANRPPTFDPTTGAMTAIGGVVLQPDEWVSVPGFAPDLETAIKGGKVTAIPTFLDWLTGASGVAGWKLLPNTDATPWTQNFSFNGWPYLSTAAGACS